MSSRRSSEPSQRRSRGGCLPSSRSQDIRGGLGADVAAADDDYRIVGLDLAGEECGGPGGAGGLARELGALVDEAERGLDLLLGDEDDLDVPADLEGEGAGEGSVQAVGDRPRRAED